MKKLHAALVALLLAWSGMPAWAGPQEDAAAAFSKGDTALAYRLYLPLANQGNAVAQLNVGWMSENGNGTAQNLDDARKWYELAAVQGHPAAQYLLGCIYDFGKGVKQNYAEALKWYQLSAASGYHFAQHNLATIYAEAKGVPLNDAEAVKWYRLSMEQGYVPSAFPLALRYTTGKGIGMDYVRAYVLFGVTANAKDAVDPETIQQAVKFRGIVEHFMTDGQNERAKKMLSDCQQRNLKGCGF